MPRSQAARSQAAAARAAFPPEPWRLVGELIAAAWLIPRETLDVPAPPGWRPLSLFGRLLVGAVWGAYGPEGDLAYREFAVGVVVRKGLRLAVSVPWIWVDSSRSRAGGRALWAVPKEMARFDGFGVRDLDGRWIASAEPDAWIAVPGRWPLRLTLAQAGRTGAVETPARLSGRLSLGRSRWRTAAPLPLLHGRPLITLRLDRARIRVGHD